MTIERLEIDAKLPYDKFSLLSDKPVLLEDYMRILVKTLQERLDDISTVSNLSIDLADGEALYLGLKDASGEYPEGTWRFIVVSGEVQLQELVSSIWTLYHKWSITEFQFSDKIKDKNSNFQILSGLITGATNTAWDAAFVHITSSGESHTFIDQSVIAGSSPNFVNENMTGNVSVWINDVGYELTTHRHDGHILEHDAVNSDGGAFAFTTTGQVTFNQSVETAKNMICNRILAGGVQP